MGTGPITPAEAVSIKKFKFNPKYLSISLYALGVIIAAQLADKLIGDFAVIKDSVSAVLSVTVKVIAPFIYGGAIAYITNPFLRFVENRILSLFLADEKRFKLKRLISRFVTFTVFIGLSVCVIAYIIPEIVISLRNLITYTLSRLPQLQRTFTEMFEGQEIISQQGVNAFTQEMFAPFQSLGSVSSILNTIVSSTVSFANTVLNLLLGVIIAFYMLGSKEDFAKYCTKVLYVIFAPDLAERIVKSVRQSNKIFEGFFIGKAIDSMIIGILCFIMLSFIRPPYVLLSSVIVGVTNMIPYFGPFIVAVPVIIITLIYDPSKAVWTALAIFILQQFDGTILGPKILGDSTGLSPIWVIFAILIGGALFGPIGMLLGVPCLAVVKILLDSFINRKFEEKYKR